MKHFDKFLNYIFPVVEEDAEETQKVVKPVVKPQPQVPVQPKHALKPQTENKAENEKVELKTREEAIANNDHLSKSKSSFSIDIDKSFEEPKFEKVKTQPVKKQTQNKYVPKPAISPIFGVLKERKDPRIIETPQYESESDIKNASKIGTIFSPIYGVAPSKREKETDPIKFKEEALTNTKATVIEKITDVDSETNCDSEPDLKQTSLMDLLDEIPDSQATTEKKITKLPTFDNLSEKEAVNFKHDLSNGNLEDILIKPKDETHIISSNENISLFDNETEEH